MRDTIVTVTLTLKNVGLPVEHRDTLIVFTVQNKLDKVLLNE